MSEAVLIKLKGILQDLIHKEIKSEYKDRSIVFYVGLIESIYSQESLLYKIILDDAEKLIKNIENKAIKLNDLTTISALIAMRLIKCNNQEVKREINAYLKGRLSDFEYSPLKNTMMLFLLCQGLDYLETAIKEVISNKLTYLSDTHYTFENTCLIYASILILNKNNNRDEKGKLVKKVIQYKPKEMTLSESVYALWFYEVFIGPYINSYDQMLKPQIERWNKELKKEIMPRLFKELSSKFEESGIDEDLTSEQLSVSAFELALIYETILKNEDKFLIISQQDFTNILFEKSKNIFLEKVKWQSYFWVLLSLVFFTLPWYLLRRFSPQVLITAMIGILLAVLTFSLRYKHIKYLLIEKRKWIKDNYKSLICSLLFGILFAYIASFADIKKIFQLELTETLNALMIAFLGIIGILLPHLVSPLKNILNDMLFSIKLPDELKEGGDYETN